MTRRFDIPYEWQIGWRYTRAGRSDRRNGFISFISGVSMLGIALGVAALIIVLSVMNGFQKEVRDRMLSVIAHVEIGSAGGEALLDWRATAAAARKEPEVIGAAPFVAAQALIARGDDVHGAIVRGIVPSEEATVTDLAAELGITARTLRFYEDQGLIQPRRLGATRVYSNRERARMILVLRGKRLGFSIREIRDYLDLYDADPRHETQTRALLAKIAQRRAQLEEQRVVITEALDGLASVERDAELQLARQGLRRKIPQGPTP